MSEPVMQFDSKVAMEQYEKRKKDNAGKKLDNSSLPAGSPMYYYCRFCSVFITSLPESHLCTAPTICTPCKVLHTHGLI